MRCPSLGLRSGTRVTEKRPRWPKTACMRASDSPEKAVARRHLNTFLVKVQVKGVGFAAA